MIPLTSEKVQGVLDDATYTATLCMARDGKHFFFTSIQVDGSVVGAPNKRWGSRRAAMAALAEIASVNRRPEGVDRDPDADILVRGSGIELLPDELDSLVRDYTPPVEPEPTAEPEAHHDEGGDK